MTLNGIKENIAERLSETDAKLTVIRRRQKHFTRGRIITKTERGYRRYYLQSESEVPGTNGDNGESNTSGDNVERYLGKGDEKIIRELELKHYYSLLEKAAAEEIRILEKIQAQLEKIPDYDKVFGRIPEYKRHLIEPFSVAINPQMSAEWRSKFITYKNIAVDTDYVTEAGVRVRSKSELIIAERLERAEIPYRYEYPVTVGDSLWFPDFIALNRTTGKEYIWEHFGMADNEAYCKSAQEKIEKYAENGMFVGQNLIVTSESSKHSLNMEYVDLIISKYLK